MSPPLMVSRASGSSVSSIMRGGLYAAGVAAPRTKSQRGVITPTPNERWLGFTRWTVIARALTGAVRTGKYWTAMESDIVTLLRGSSSGCRTLEAEATSLEGVAPVWRESGNVVYRT